METIAQILRLGVFFVSAAGLMIALIYCIIMTLVSLNDVCDMWESLYTYKKNSKYRGWLGFKVILTFVVYLVGTVAVSGTLIYFLAELVISST